ncbi:MAG: hypothetical protein ACXV5L_03905 [Thermoanaerobaculia bacterium]
MMTVDAGQWTVDKAQRRSRTCAFSMLHLGHRQPVTGNRMGGRTR